MTPLPCGCKISGSRGLLGGQRSRRFRREPLSVQLEQSDGKHALRRSEHTRPFALSALFSLLRGFQTSASAASQQSCHENLKRLGALCAASAGPNYPVLLARTGRRWRAAVVSSRLRAARGVHKEVALYCQRVLRVPRAPRLGHSERLPVEREDVLAYCSGWTCRGAGMGALARLPVG